MNWVEINIRLGEESLEAVTAILLDAGCQGVAEDSSKPGILSAFMEETPDFDVKFQELSGKLSKISQFGLEPPSSIATHTVNETDWAHEWKKYFKPMEIGEKLVIKPSWEDYEVERTKIILELDPGQAFGTGGHATTRLCLIALEDYIHPGDKVADIGTGSGILSIAAAKLGASEAHATDIDDLPRRVARENVERNGVADKVTVHEREEFDTLVSDCNLVIANIIADTIIELMPSFYARLREGGVLITSGIVAERLNDVQRSAENIGFHLLEVREEDIWRALIHKK
jgi:ribosomal protein L11 methyltransferase